MPTRTRYLLQYEYPSGTGALITLRGPSALRKIADRYGLLYPISMDGFSRLGFGVRASMSEWASRAFYRLRDRGDSQLGYDATFTIFREPRRLNVHRSGYVQAILHLPSGRMLRTATPTRPAPINWISSAEAEELFSQGASSSRRIPGGR